MNDGVLNFSKTPLVSPQATYTTFDVPGGLQSANINPAGAITGWYSDTSGVFHGFLRAPDGTITTFDPPGSTSTIVGSGGEPFAGPPINPAGVITGYYSDASGGTHGFLRAANGTFTTFDAPGAVNGTSFLCCITPAGAVAGISFDANFVGHGFLRAPDGTFTSFDPQGSTFTAPSGINPAGTISGLYFDANFVEHGFLRDKHGTITTFDAPGCLQRHTTQRHQPGRSHRRILF
jgi:hypothetical protein